MSKLTQRLGLSRFEADEHYAAALRAFRGRDLAAAIKAMEAAISLLPRHAEYHAVLGFFLLENKRGEAAAQAFDQALDLDPYDMLANYGKGMSAYRAKDWQGAETCFARAHAARPARPETLYYLAMVQHRLGSNAEALRWMEAARGAFAQAEDKRARHCLAWMSEFEKLIAP